jgi:hypothetical protein
MKSTSIKIVGCLLILLGVVIAIFSEWIVFPGLERLVGIETIVGKTNVYYLPDGGYGFTNPAAMLSWIALVRAVGVLICTLGGWLLFRARKGRPKSFNESIDKHAA